MHFHSMGITQTYTLCVGDPSRGPAFEIQVGDPASASRQVGTLLLMKIEDCVVPANELLPQAFRYLSSEVLSQFVSSESPLGLLACLHTTKRVVWTLEDAARNVRQSFVHAQL